MADNKPKEIRELTDEILARIDVIRAYSEAGVRFTQSPRASGFAECFAFGREDTRPSAVVKVTDGFYKDSAGDGRTISFWDFMAAHHPSVASRDFFGAVRYFAERAGIEIDSKDSHKRKNSYDKPAEVFEWLPEEQSYSFLWTFAFKRNTSVEALSYAGCKIARWRCFNKKAKGDKPAERIIGRELVCAVPFYAPGKFEEPAAYQAWNVTGGPLPLFAGKDKPPEMLKIVSAGPIRGTLANARAVKWLHDANALAAGMKTTPPIACRVWKTCGPSDMLALISIIPEELLNDPQHPHLVTTNGNGESGDCTAEQARLFTAQNVFIPADADPSGAGMLGAIKWANVLAPHTPTIRIFQLFEPTKENKEAGRKDLRDWIRLNLEDGGAVPDKAAIYAELCRIADEAEIYTPSTPEPTVVGARAEPADSGNTATDTTANKTKSITNQIEEYIGGKQFKKSVKPDQILLDIYKQTDGWPRKCGGVLFWHDHDSPAEPVKWIRNTASLFAFIHNKCGEIDWQRGSKLITQDQFFQHVKDRATEYESIEFYPNWPKVPRTYYVCKDPIEPPPEKIGDAIAELVDLFNFESATDYALAVCFILTLYWGHPGSKPAFAITAPDGRGAGKTTFVDELAELVGGYLDVSGQATAEIVLQRLLSEEGMAKRVCRIDNIKTNRFSWDMLESIITAKTITGKRLWVGEAKRKNNIVWAMTVNGPSFSTDMAQRSIEIQLKRPDIRVSNFKEKLIDHIAINRDRIAGDAIAMLKRNKVDFIDTLEHDSRWGEWFSEIVGRICQDEDQARRLHSQIMHVTKTRQMRADDEAEDLAEFESYMCDQIVKLGFRLNQALHISNYTLCDWYRDHSQIKENNRNITKMLRRAVDQKQLNILRHNPSHKARTGFIYRDPPDSDAAVNYQLDEAWIETKRTKRYPTSNF